jgi:hypothetical protein
MSIYHPHLKRMKEFKLREKQWIDWPKEMSMLELLGNNGTIPKRF